MVATTYLDTNVFITAYETSDEHARAALELLTAIGAGEAAAVTSELTLAELLPKPLALGQSKLVAFYTELLSSGMVRVTPVTRPVLLEAAHRRADDPALKVADAIHLATAVQQGCTTFLSDDRRLRSITGLQVARCDLGMLERLRLASRG